MSHETDAAEQQGKADTSFSEEFALYCDAEIEKRLNTGEKLDADAYHEAKDMVIKKLKAQEDDVESYVNADFGEDANKNTAVVDDDTMEEEQDDSDTEEEA